MNKLLLICLLVILALPALCVNNMEMMQQINGDRLYGDFGWGLTALDFNADGYDDMAVMQRGWVPDSISTFDPILTAWGRVMIYYGGPDFDGIADFIIPGAYNWNFGSQHPLIHNMGDINGDGFDDLGVKGNTDPASTPLPHGYRAIFIYFGGPNPSHQPAYTKYFSDIFDWSSLVFDPLGDVDGDGYCDLSYTFEPDSESGTLSRCGIIWGGDMIEQEIIRYPDAGFCVLNNVGDVNADGYQDCVKNIFYRTVNNQRIANVALFWGSPNRVFTDSLTLFTSQLDNPQIIFSSSYLGDLNADGHDDYTGLITFSQIKIWYGVTNSTQTPDFFLTPAWCGDDAGRSLVHGDLNNDGYEDVIGADIHAAGSRGAFKVWLGGENMNGTADLQEICLTYLNMGAGLAAGDFNADGFYDVAAGAPHDVQSGWYQGNVYVYAGNAELADTTVGAADDTTPVPDTWSFKVFPNPLPGRKYGKLVFVGKGYDQYHRLTLKIYNIKGQKVKSFSLNTEEIKASQTDLPAIDLPAGVYQFSLFSQGQLLKTIKTTIR
jgi:hypothetical protein